MFLPFFENVPLVKFIYLVFTRDRMPGRVTVGHSGLCCCVPCLSNAIISFRLLRLQCSQHTSEPVFKPRWTPADFASFICVPFSSKAAVSSCKTKARGNSYSCINTLLSHTSSTGCKLAAVWSELQPFLYRNRFIIQNLLRAKHANILIVCFVQAGLKGSCWQLWK